MADLTQTAANVLPSASATGILTNALAGATITQGKVCFRDATDSNKVKLSDANGAAPLNSVYGIALNAASPGQYVALVTTDPALNIGVALTPGIAYFLSNTPGGICPYADLTSGSTAIFLGIGNADGTLNFQPLKGGTIA